MRATGCPNVEEFFVGMLLQPPSEAKVLAMYASAELTQGADGRDPERDREHRKERTA